MGRWRKFQRWRDLRSEVGGCFQDISVIMTHPRRVSDDFGALCAACALLINPRMTFMSLKNGHGDTFT